MTVFNRWRPGDNGQSECVTRGLCEFQTKRILNKIFNSLQADAISKECRGQGVVVENGGGAIRVFQVSDLGVDLAAGLI